MKGHNAFGRANAMMAQIASIISWGMTRFATQQQINALAPYESHGKRATKRHDRGGTKRAQRAALKARNVKANRRAHR